MPKICTPLTDTAVRNAKPREKTYTLGDGEGIYLEVMPNGTKFWRMACRQPNGRKNRLTFGKYPVVTLAEARTRLGIRHDEHWDFVATKFVFRFC
jgi:hypothetical protein